MTIPRQSLQNGLYFCAREERRKRRKAENYKGKLEESEKDPAISEALPGIVHNQFGGFADREYRGNGFSAFDGEIIRIHFYRNGF